MSEAILSVDFQSTVGAVKPMHGIGQPPLTWLSNELFPYLEQAGIPYSRLHDVGGWMGGGLYVDIPNLFPDFDADETDPASYNFEYTDEIIKGLMKVHCEPYFRLGVTIENEHQLKAFRIFPPADFQKWARVCEYVIRHYNEGWANGFHFGITYWEIWNEPDDCCVADLAAMWKGTPEQYFELYSVTARHLKACFGDAIKVGGYGSCGVYEHAKDADLSGIPEEHGIYDMTINFLHKFLAYQRDTHAPIDFFSWHVYDNCSPSVRADFARIAEHAAYCRRILDHYGFTATEHHLNEWNLWTKRFLRDSPIGAAKTLGFMLLMQNTSTDVMCYYDGGVGYSDYRALFNADNGAPYRTYYAFSMFNGLYRLKNQAALTQSGDRVYAGAAVQGSEASIVLANPSEEPCTVRMDLQGFSADATQIFRLDEVNRYTLTGEKLVDNTITLPAYGCAEIKLWSLGK